MSESDDDDGFAIVHVTKQSVVTPKVDIEAPPEKETQKSAVLAAPLLVSPQKSTTVDVETPLVRPRPPSDRENENDGFMTVHAKNFTRDSIDDDGFKTVHAKTMGIKGRETECKDNLQLHVAPSIKTASAHFMQQLPRRVRDPKQPSGYRLCLPGEMRGTDGEPATLYNPFTSNADHLFEFGIGISLYFRTLKLMFFVTLVCSIVMSFPIAANKKLNPEGIDRTLLGSTVGATRESLSYSDQGTPDLIITVLLLLVALASGWLQSWTVSAVDKLHLSASDFSVRIDNPPRNISDPDVYHKFFSTFGDVVLITIALNNGELITSMSNKKCYESMSASQTRYKQIAKNRGVAYRDQEDVGCVETSLQTFGFAPTLGYANNLLNAEKKLINSMVLQDFHPWRVYVTFAKQADQRKCLKRTAVSYFAIMSGSAPGSEANFQGCLLNIDRAPEPSDIVYDNSHYTFFGRWIRTVLSYFICSIVLVLVFVIIKAMGSSSAGVIAAFISGVNVVLPQFVRITTLYIERHVKKSDEQTSVLIKLAVVRCVNSGVLIYLSAPSLQQFSAEHLNHVQNILIADSITTPLLRVLDIPGLISRHYSSKGVATQDELNVLFTPAEWSLAERYTDMLKTLFVGFFFAVPVPSGLIITCFAMFTTYFVDKYSLMRQWKRNTGLDESLSTVARYVLLLIVFAHVAVSKVYFANWPFAEAATIVDCQFLTCSIGPFMSSEQKALVKLYNILNIILFVIVIVWFVFVNFGGWILSLFVDGSNINVNERDEDDTKTTYRDPNAKFPAYIPIIEPQAYPDPIIMADVSKLPKQYMPLTRSELFNLDKLDPAQLSVVRTEELPTVSDERVLKSLFTSVCYYEPLGKAFTPYVKPVFQAAGGISAVGSPILVDGFGRTARGTTVSVPAPTSLDLPVGWVEKKDATGKVYYSNSITKVTSWNRPTN